MVVILVMAVVISVVIMVMMMMMARLNDRYDLDGGMFVTSNCSALQINSKYVTCISL